MSVQTGSQKQKNPSLLQRKTNTKINCALLRLRVLVTVPRRRSLEGHLEHHQPSKDGQRPTGHEKKSLGWVSRFCSETQVCMPDVQKDQPLKHEVCNKSLFFGGSQIRRYGQSPNPSPSEENNKRFERGLYVQKERN